MRKRTLAALTGAAALAVALTACTSPAGGDSTDAEGNTQVTLGLAGQPAIFQSTVAQVAVDQGFFEDEGLDVTLRPFATGVDVARAIQSGELEGGMIITQAAASINANGGDLIGILGFENPSYTLVSADPSVSTCEDVKGKTVATDSPGTPLNFALTTILASCGLTLDDINSVAVNGTATFDAMYARQVDIAILHPEQIVLVQQDHPLTIIDTVAALDPNVHYMLLATTQKQLDDPKQRDKWVAVDRAMIKAIDFMNDEANSEAVAKSASTVTTRDTDVTLEALPGYLDLGMWPVDSDGLSKNRIEATIGNEVKLGNITEANKPTYDQVADPSVYADAAK